MDAFRFPALMRDRWPGVFAARGALGALIAALAGCQGILATPDASKTDPQPTPDGEPLVVQKTPASRPAGSIDAALAEKIEQWADRVQRADAQRTRPPTDRPSYAADQLPAGPYSTRLTRPIAKPEATAAGSRGMPARGSADPGGAGHEIKVHFTPESTGPASRPAESTAPRPTNKVSGPPVVKNVFPTAPSHTAGLGAAPSPDAINLNDPKTAAAPGSLSEMFDQLFAHSADGGFREQMDRRIAAVLIGDYVKARQPFELVPDEQGQLGQKLVETLIAIRDQSGGDPAGESTDALRRITELRQSLRSVSDLDMSAVVVCRAVRGFGQYDPIESARFSAGQINEFVLYCELRDFASAEQADGSFESRFSLKVTILSHSGDEVSSLAADDIVDRCRTRRNDCFLSPVIRLPGTLSPGEYSARVTVEDKIKKRVVERFAKFRLVSKG